MDLTSKQRAQLRGLANSRDINETNIIDYNKMIKQPVNYKSLGKQRDILKDVI